MFPTCFASRETVKSSSQQNAKDSSQQWDPVIADARNDIHLILSQLIVQFMLLHNKIATLACAKIQNRLESIAFNIAESFVTGTYRNIILYDYLVQLLHPSFRALVEASPPESDDEAAKMPVEFVIAGARAGHAMTRNFYTVNDGLGPRPTDELLQRSSLAQKPTQLPVSAKWAVQWEHFFELDDRIAPQLARRFTPFYAAPFFQRFPSSP